MPSFMPDDKTIVVFGTVKEGPNVWKPVCPGCDQDLGTVEAVEFCTTPETALVAYHKRCARKLTTDAYMMTQKVLGLC